jgi:hypothetical protein
MGEGEGRDRALGGGSKSGWNRSTITIEVEIAFV